MEGLISARIFPIRGYSSQGNTTLFPTHTSNRRRVFCGPIKMMAPTNSSNSKAGSVKPMTASSLGRLDNTLPSKAISYNTNLS
ncbi:hypothetical protein HanXRQr2_Chr08g0360331 [Helianthus annuus]|nr:hypothetical protein HanXRQr2_Chr08g0360331 [Helianthus annuus]